MNRKRWAGIPKEERSRKMSVVAHARHAKYTIEERKEIGRKLTLARKSVKALQS